MNHELEFAKKIEEIRETAALQGNVLTSKQVEEAFAQIGMKSEQLGPVYDYLKTKKIGIDEKIDPSEFLTEEEIDYVAMYTESLSDLPKLNDGEKRALYMAAMNGEAQAKKKDEHVIKYSRESEERLRDIETVIKFIKQMDVPKERKRHIHKTLSHYRTELENVVLFGELGA